MLARHDDPRRGVAWRGISIGDSEMAPSVCSYSRLVTRRETLVHVRTSGGQERRGRHDAPGPAPPPVAAATHQHKQGRSAVVGALDYQLQDPGSILFVAFFSF